MRALVVDDEPDVKPLFEQHFRREKKKGEIELVFALSAEEALEMLDNHLSTDLMLILSDINMPGMNGLELLRIVKERYPMIKVFMITAYDDDEKYQKAVEFGSDDYFTKPIDFQTLKKKMLGI